MPGFILSGLAAILTSLMVRRARQPIQDKFATMEKSMDEVPAPLL